MLMRSASGRSQRLSNECVAEAALLYDDILDNYKLEKCKNIADYAELSRARNSIYSFDSRWDLPDAILISIFMRGLGPSYKSWNSTFWLHNNLASTKNKDGSETDGFTFREVVDFAQKEEALQSQDDKNEGHALSAHSGRPFCDHCKKPGYRISQLNLLHQVSGKARDDKKAKRNELKTKQTSGPSEPTTQQPLPDTSNQGLIS
ncbi:hypothetical protein E4U50_000917 [Claviceps purpurea]|nr:hypothetical protein E4U50_000917 [Claviceps purpurea]